MIVAATAEVPLGCPNRVERGSLAHGAVEYLTSGRNGLTPTAAVVLASSTCGNRPGSLRELLLSGELTILEARVRHAIRASGASAVEEPPPAAVEPVTPDEVKTWIKFKVVDDRTSDPVAGVELVVTLPDGEERTGKTRANGMVELDDIDPGACDVRCELNRDRIRLANTGRFVIMGDAPVEVVPDPDLWLEARPPERAFIAHIDEHKVTTGETIESLANANGLTWQQLAQFNWDTSVPDEINEHLRDEVGCTQKTPDGFNYIFTTEDEPGLIHIPKPWQQTELPTEQTHVIRVKLIRKFIVILENEEGLRNPEAEYRASLADGSTKEGRLGLGGTALIKDPPPGEIEVVFPDLDDVAAKSLAACARQALADDVPIQVARALKNSGAMIELIIEKYDQYYNDYTGQGFREDLHHALSDPVARMAIDNLLYFGGVDDPLDQLPPEEDSPLPEDRRGP